MTIIVIQPSWTVHFCGSGLAEVSFVNDLEMESTCCDAYSKTDSSGVEFEKKNCCRTDVLTLDTDDYQSVVSPSIPVPVDCELLALFATIINQPSVSEQGVAYSAPAGVLMADDVYLPFICIFRI